ncbi:MAG: hypothetical protein ACXWJW_12015 [Xanthobacteraceae bacterium]
MSADKDPIRSTHETLALIADKLAIDRPSNSDISAPEPPIVVPPAPMTPSELKSQEPQASTVSPVDTAQSTEPPPAPTVQPAVESPSTLSIPPAAPVVPFPVAAKLKSQPVRDALVTYFPMAIAVLSLVLSIYQGYLFHESLALSNQSIDVMQRNVARGEFSRACRDVIETYFQVKQKVSVLMPAADRSNVAGASRVTEASRLEAQGAIAKFGGLGTYLANFQDAATRTRYTELTRTLTGIMESARTTPLPDIDKLFQPADKLFGQMNEDCARLSRTMRM